ncbi:MAG: transporter substrate-binding domain-containing protein [Bacteroidota bacterium]
MKVALLSLESSEKLVSLFLSCCFLILFCSCRPTDTPDVAQSAVAMNLPSGMSTIPAVSIDMPQILERDTLRVILSYSGSSYFIYKGQTMGYEYELAERLAEDLGVELKIIVAKNMDRMSEMLLRGEGDMIGQTLTITKDRKKYLAFTDHLIQTQQVLVQRKPSNWRDMKLHEIDKTLIRNPIDLIDQKVSIRVGSAYHERLFNLMEEVGGEILVDTLPGTITTDEVIGMVASGELEYTISDRHIALINTASHPRLDIETPVSLRQRLAWAVRPNSPELLEALNEWLRRMHQETDFFVIYNKYFKNKTEFRNRSKSEFYSKKGKKISPFDTQIRTHADSLEWDWRLLAAQIYQESEFDPKTRSWAGACGLMQVVPATGKQFGIDQLFDPDENMKAGTSYLRFLQGIWEEIPDSVEKIKFVLASYNAGPGHVLDARRLAEKHGKDPNLWTGSVDEFILLKSNPEYYNDPVVEFGYCRGKEPFAYVNSIFERYENYRQHVD